MKRINKAKRAFLLAVVRGSVCEVCESAPAAWGWFGVLWECGPCKTKRVGRERKEGRHGVAG